MAQSKARKQRQESFAGQRKLLRELACLIRSPHWNSVTRERQALFLRMWHAKSREELAAIRAELHTIALAPRLATGRAYTRYVGLRKARVGETISVYGGGAAGFRYVERRVVERDSGRFVPRVTSPRDAFVREIRTMVAPEQLAELMASGAVDALLRRQARRK